MYVYIYIIRIIWTHNIFHDISISKVKRNLSDPRTSISHIRMWSNLAMEQWSFTIKNLHVEQDHMPVVWFINLHAMWVKKCHVHHPWLGMARKRPIYGDEWGMVFRSFPQKLPAVPKTLQKCCHGTEKLGKPRSLREIEAPKSDTIL